MKMSRLSRLVRLITLLQSGRGHNANSLARSCEVSRRTIFRDVAVLREAGIPLEFDEEQQRYSIPGQMLLPPTAFTADEALALIGLCYELGDHGGLPFYAAASSAASKLESSLPHRLHEHVRKLCGAVEIKLEPTNPIADGEPVYQQLREAIAHRRAVRIRYDSLTEWELITTKLKPYRLLFSRRAWYVIGRSSLHRSTRTFNVSRIRHIELLDETFQVPRGFSIDRYLRNAWHLIPEPGPDRDVWIHFQPMVAQNVAEVTWHKTQRVEFNDDGTLDFHVRVSGLNEISWWVLGYGDQAEVVEPVELREIIIQRSRRMLKRYGAKLPTAAEAG